MSKFLPSSLNETHIAWIIRRLGSPNPILRDPLSIKEDFSTYFSRPVDGVDIEDIRERYPEKISKEFNDEVNNIQAQPMAHAYVRLSLIAEGVQDARKERILSSHRTGEDTWTEERGMNLPALATFIRMGREEEYQNKKFWLELMKMKIEDEKEIILASGFTNIQINTGIKDAQKHTDK